jgi:hypothetical protein
LLSSTHKEKGKLHKPTMQTSQHYSGVVKEGFLTQNSTTNCSIIGREQKQKTKKNNTNKQTRVQLSVSNNTEQLTSHTGFFTM